MKFSQSLDLALHALVIIAASEEGKPLFIKDLAKELHASESYLARVMLWLAKADILKSVRGKKGGFTFKTSPDVLTIADVVIAIDKDAGDFICQGEERNCDCESHCRVLAIFNEAKEQMLQVLRGMTIADIVQMKKGNLSGVANFVPENEIRVLSE